MTTEAFNRGFAALSKVFTGLNLDPKLYWEALNDLDGEYYLRAVWKIIKETIEIYPGTNLIAMLRFHTEEFGLEALKTKTLKLTAESEKQRIDRWEKESVPMPEECREALKRLGVK